MTFFFNFSSFKYKVSGDCHLDEVTFNSVHLFNFG